MTAKDQGECDLSTVPDDETRGSGHNANEEVSRSLSSRVLRPRPNKLSSTMAVNTEALVNIKTDTTTNALETPNSERLSSRMQSKAFNTKIGEIVDQGAGSKTINDASLDVPVSPPSATVGTLCTRNSRLLNSEEYPMVFEPDMMISVYHEETVKKTPWLSDDLQERALLKLEDVMRTHEKLRGDEVRYGLSIRRLQPTPIKLTDALFDVYSWLRTWSTIFELIGDNVSYEGACKIRDWHLGMWPNIQSSEAEIPVGVTSSEVGIDSLRKGHEDKSLLCQEKMMSAPLPEETSTGPAAAKVDVSASTDRTASMSGLRAPGSPLQITHASLSYEEPSMEPSSGQNQVPFQLPKDQLLLLKMKRSSNVGIAHEKRVEGLRPTFVYFKNLSDVEKATVICETVQRWISDGSKELGAKEVKSLSYLIGTMHDFLARQIFAGALPSALFPHEGVIDEVAKMPTRLRKLIFMMWAKDWIGTNFQQPEPTVANSLRLTMTNLKSQGIRVLNAVRVDVITAVNRTLWGAAAIIAEDYTNMERAQAPVSDVESRNVPSIEPTTLRPRDVSSDRNDTLPFLLLPDITLAIEVRGRTRYFPWFSDNVQHRAYATVDQFLRSDDGRTVTAAEVPSLRLGTMPRPLHISPNHILLGMRTWLNGWIHFYATKGEEDRANALRNFQRIFVEVPPTQSAPTSSFVTDDDSSDGEDVVDEGVVVSRSSFQDGTPADAGLRLEQGPRMDSTHKDLPHVSITPNHHHPHEAVKLRTPADEVCSTMNATLSPADAPTDRQEDGRRDHSGITWAKMRAKYGKKRACEDMPHESELAKNLKCPNDAIVDKTIAQGDRSDDISQALSRQEIEPAKEVTTSITENCSAESELAWGMATSYYLDEAEEYCALEDEQLELEDVTEEMGDMVHHTQASNTNIDRSNHGNGCNEKATDEASSSIQEAALIEKLAAREKPHLDALPATNSKTGDAKDSIDKSYTDAIPSAATPPVAPTTEHPVFFIDPFGHTHRVPLSSCTYSHLRSIILSKCDMVPKHFRERVMQRQFSILTTDGTAVARQNFAETVLPGSVLEIYWQQKGGRGNDQDQCRFDNLPTRHPVHAEEAATARPIQSQGNETEIILENTSHGSGKKEGRTKPLTPKKVDHNHDKVGAQHEQQAEDNILPNNRKRPLTTSLQEAGPKRRKPSDVLVPHLPSNSTRVRMQDSDASQQMAMSKSLSTQMSQQKQASNADGNDIQLQIQGGMRTKSQRQRQPQKVESRSLTIKPVHVQLADQAEQPERPSLGASSTSVTMLGKHTNPHDKQKTLEQQKKVHTSHPRTLEGVKSTQVTDPNTEQSHPVLPSGGQATDSKKRNERRRRSKVAGRYRTNRVQNKDAAA